MPRPIVPRKLAVELEHVTVALGGRPVLHDIAWRIAPGERWALIGANGAGKSVLLKVVAGDVWPTPDGRERRIYTLDGAASPQPLDAKDEIAYLGPERQDRYERYGWDFDAVELLGTGVHRTDIPLSPLRAPHYRRIATLLKQMGLERFARRRLLSLSYGERRMLLLARAYAWNPSLLLLDEATNGLDTDHRNAFLRSLETHASRVPWVFSSHRVEDVPRTANRLLVLREGRVHYSGKLDAAALREAFASSYRRTAPRVPAARPIARVRRRRAPAALVELESASFYVDAKRVLRELSFAVFAGECWVVHGRNGAGKSTLLRALYGDLGAAVGGTVRRAGIEPGVPIEAWKRTTGFIAPALQSEHPRELSVLEVVASGRHASIGLNDALTAADRRAALGALDAFGLTKLAERAIAELSYGLVRRVLFARAWVKVPRLMLLDEPFAGVDTETRIALLARLDRLTAEEGVALVIATHHRAEWPPSATHELELAKGGMRYCGPLRASPPLNSQP